MSPQLELVTEIRSIDRVKPYEKNARKIPQAAIDKVALSIQEFGWQQPIVVDENDVIIVGHVRRLAALKLQLTQVPVWVARGLSPEKVKAYRLMDNRSHEDAKWDLNLLTLELQELKLEGLNLELTGFSGAELAEVQKSGGLTPADSIVDPAKVPITRRGDLWTMGPHALLCGDSTSPADVGLLLGSRLRPVLMTTDPPYGVEYDPAWRDDYAPSATFSSNRVAQGKMAPNSTGKRARGTVQNDEEMDWAPAYALFPGDVAYVWHAGVYAAEVAIGIQKADFEIRAQIIWRKQHFVFGRGAYHWQHEPCWYAVKKGATAHWTGDRTQTTVWDVANLNPMGGNREEKATGHGTQKPVELMRRPIANHTLVGEAIYDPFLGSGTSLIAAQETGRICYALDLAPLYVDVAVRRWQEFTGQQATLEGTAGRLRRSLTAGKPPARTPGARMQRSKLCDGRASLHAVDEQIFVVGAADRVAFLSERRDEPADRMSLPAGNLHNLLRGDSLGAPHQGQDGVFLAGRLGRRGGRGFCLGLRRDGLLSSFLPGRFDLGFLGRLNKRYPEARRALCCCCAGGLGLLRFGFHGNKCSFTGESQPSGLARWVLRPSLHPVRRQSPGGFVAGALASVVAASLVLARKLASDRHQRQPGLHVLGVVHLHPAPALRVRPVVPSSWRLFDCWEHIGGGVARLWLVCGVFHDQSLALLIISKVGEFPYDGNNLKRLIECACVWFWAFPTSATRAGGSN